jgi:hypothetical protein
MTYRLTLVPEPGNWSAPVDRRLAQALKMLKRGFGLRCIQAVTDDFERRGQAGERQVETTPPEVRAADVFPAITPGATKGKSK